MLVLFLVSVSAFGQKKVDIAEAHMYKALQESRFRVLLVYDLESDNTLEHNYHFMHRLNHPFCIPFIAMMQIFASWDSCREVVLQVVKRKQPYFTENDNKGNNDFCGIQSKFQSIKKEMIVLIQYIEMDESIFIAGKSESIEENLIIQIGHTMIPRFNIVHENRKLFKMKDDGHRIQHTAYLYMKKSCIDPYQQHKMDMISKQNQSLFRENRRKNFDGFQSILIYFTESLTCYVKKDLIQTVQQEYRDVINDVYQYSKAKNELFGNPDKDFQKSDFNLPPSTQILPLSLSSKSNDNMVLAVSTKSRKDQFARKRKQHINELVMHLNDTLVNDIITNTFTSFVYHNIQEIRKSTRTMETSKNVDVRENVAIIVEPRITPTFEFCVRNVFFHLESNRNQEWFIRVYHSNNNAAFVYNSLSDLISSGNVMLVNLDDLLKQGVTAADTTEFSSNDYNQLLKSNRIWSDLDKSKVKFALIFQTDSVLIDVSPLKYYKKYDFVGAPWNIDADASSSEWIRSHMRIGKIKSGCCNGGLSLRKVASMLQITNKYKSKNPSVNEDLFFIRHAEELGMTLPDRRDAYCFAQEINCTDIISSGIRGKCSTPLGLHSAWAYNENQEYIYSLLKASMRIANF